MYPHRIRLRGPWECERDGTPPHRVTMPGRWADAGLAGYRGFVRFTRKFGYPGRIDEQEHVWLTCAGCTGLRQIHLNGTALQPADYPTTATPRCDDGPFAFEVTSLLKQRNQVEFHVHGATDEAGLWGEVALEIRRDAYLANVCLESSEGGLFLSGRVVGVAPGALEVYVLVDGQHRDYFKVQPRLEGEPFGIELKMEASVHERVRVELIHVSRVWYVVELSVRDWLSQAGSL